VAPPLPLLALTLVLPPLPELLAELLASVGDPTVVQPAQLARVATVMAAAVSSAW
jgi:hypothetical protein